MNGAILASQYKVGRGRASCKTLASGRLDAPTSRNTPRRPRPALGAVLARRRPGRACNALGAWRAKTTTPPRRQPPDTPDRGVPSRRGQPNASAPRRQHRPGQPHPPTMEETMAALQNDGEEDNAELLALQRIDETCTNFQQNGQYLEALECMERGLVLRQHFFGAGSDEVWRACKTVGEMCNLLAMTYLQQEDFAMVLELLKKAEILTERDPAGRAVTFNNLACYYRRQGKLHAALQYLQKALKIEGRLESVDNPADTYLNACAVLSQLGRHQSALEHAQQALILLQEELSSVLGSDNAGPPKADRVAVLAIAYHNVGVEQEFLKKHNQSLQSYRKGVEVAERYLGGDHAITSTLRNSCVAARRTMLARDPQARLQGMGKKAARRAPGGVVDKTLKKVGGMISPRG